MLPQLVAAVVLLSLVGAQCPNGTVYDSTFQKCYQFVSTPTNYMTAEAYCVSIGGHLVTVGSGFENSFITGMARGQGNPWLGYSYLLATQWSWTSGLHSNFSNFGSGQPADPSAYQCASQKSTDGSWIKELCFANRPYVCEVYPNAPPASGCATQAPATTASPAGPVVCSTGYTMYTGTSGNKMCFKVDSVERGWKAAIAFCAQDGGVLPKIEDSTTNAFLLALAGEETVYHDPWIGLVCPSRHTADCYWISDNSKLGSYQPWDSGFGPVANNGTYMETWGDDSDGEWVAWQQGFLDLSTFCQKDPVPVSVFIEESRLKRAARKEKKLVEKIRSDLKL